MRLLIVSNRLPITLEVEKEKIQVHESMGGLVSGLSSYLDSMKASTKTDWKYIWIGWPGVTVPDRMKEKVKKILSEYQAYPVFISETMMHDFYYGFCNKTIWPLFHYFPSFVNYEDSNWVQYKKVNEIFYSTVLQILKPEDMVWIHDYHLMLLPKLIRETFPSIRIGFFLHIPFPSYEIFRLLPYPWQKELLLGLCGADVIGFHTNDYTQYFLRCLLRVLGIDHDMGEFFINDRLVKARTFPMGIDFRKYAEASHSEHVLQEKKKIQAHYRAYRVILSIDRLDYSKGILNRLKGFEIFLQQYPKWQKKVVLLLIVVPSRIGVEHYERINRQIEEYVSGINGKYGTLDWTPIVYQYKYLPFKPLVALYGLSDVALITPLRDGMNLVSKEYIASRTDRRGILVLSEMAGSAKELGEAILVNPNSIYEIAEALHRALEMPIEERKIRNMKMQERLRKYDVIHWAEDFLGEVSEVRTKNVKLQAKAFDSHVRRQCLQDFRNAKKRLLLLDYDGTLVPFADHPSQAIPDEKVKVFLATLVKDSRNRVILISGRERHSLEAWFGEGNLILIAEHGAWLKEFSHEWKILNEFKNDWKPKLRPLLELYLDRVLGSWIEEKEFSLAWHYRKVDPELGPMRAKELMDELIQFTANMDVQILKGSKVIEVRSIGVNKGVAVKRWLLNEEYDFILAIGDDWTDEDLFRELPETAYSIRIGMVPSYARFNLNDQNEVIRLLEELVRETR